MSELWSPFKASALAPSGEKDHSIAISIKTAYFLSVRQRHDSHRRAQSGVL